MTRIPESFISSMLMTMSLSKLSTQRMQEERLLLLSKDGERMKFPLFTIRKTSS
jgi:hypothetical protein